MFVRGIIAIAVAGLAFAACSAEQPSPTPQDTTPERPAAPRSASQAPALKTVELAITGLS